MEVIVLSGGVVKDDQGKRRTEGAVLDLDDADVKLFISLGIVGPYSLAISAAQAAADQAAADAAAQAAADQAAADAAAQATADQAAADAAAQAAAAATKAAEPGTKKSAKASA